MNYAFLTLFICVEGQKNKVPTSKALPKLPTADQPNEGPRKLHVRTSPLVLHSTMHNLRKNQKEYIDSIGLGHLLRMKVDGTPTMIAYYSVFNFDPERCVLRLSSGEIEITRQVVQSLLGLPLGQVKIKSLPFRPNDEDTTRSDWEAQFEDAKSVRPNAVKDAMLADPEVSLMFKVNLFVLLCNTLGKTHSMGICDLSMLPYVSQNLDLSCIDWCDYVLECLKDTRFGWNPHKPSANYFGPVVLLTVNVTLLSYHKLNITFCLS